MKLTHDHRTISSFALWLNHVITEKGEAFGGYSGAFTRINSNYNGLYAYGAPYKSLVNDTSIPGVNVISGVYLNGTFVTIGTSGLNKISYDDGAAYFTGQLASSVAVSGRCSYQEINIRITDQPESKLLLNTKYVANSKFNQQLSGLQPDTLTSPIMFLKYKSSENLPFSFGGIDDNSIKIRAVLIADSEYTKIGVANILKNLNLSGFQIVQSNPLGFRNEYTGVPFNYNNLSFDTTYAPFVKEVRIFDVPWVGEYENLPKNAVLADFEIFCAMRHNT